MDLDDEYSGWIDWDQRNEQSWHAGGLDEIDSFYHVDQVDDNKKLHRDNSVAPATPHSSSIDNDMQQAAHILTSLQTSLTTANPISITHHSENTDNDPSPSATTLLHRDSVIADTAHLPSSSVHCGIQEPDLAPDASESNEDAMGLFDFKNPFAHGEEPAPASAPTRRDPRRNSQHSIDAPHSRKPAEEANAPHVSIEQPLFDASGRETRLSNSAELSMTRASAKSGSPDPFQTPLKYGPGPPSSPNTGRKSLHEEIRKTVNLKRRFDDTPVRQFSLSADSKRRKGGLSFNNRDNPTIPPTPEMLARREKRLNSAPTLRRGLTSPISDPREIWSDPARAVDAEKSGTALEHSSPSVRTLAQARAVARSRHQRTRNSDSAVPLIPTDALVIDLSTPVVDLITPAVIGKRKRGAAPAQANEPTKASANPSSSPDVLAGPPTKKRKGAAALRYSTPEPGEGAPRWTRQASSPASPDNPTSPPEESAEPVKPAAKGVSKNAVPDAKNADSKASNASRDPRLKNLPNKPAVTTRKSKKPRTSTGGVSVSETSDLSSLASERASSPPTAIEESQLDTSQVDTSLAGPEPVAGQKRKRNNRGTHPLGARELAGMLGSVGDEGLKLNGISMGGSPRRTRRQKAEAEAAQPAPAAAAKKRLGKKK